MDGLEGFAVIRAGLLGKSKHLPRDRQDVPGNIPGDDELARCLWRTPNGEPKSLSFHNLSRLAVTELVEHIINMIG